MLPGTLYGAYVHDVRCIRRGTGRVLTLARYALARECAHTYHVLGSFDLLPDTRRVNVWLARDHVRLKERESMTRERKRERARAKSQVHIFQPVNGLGQHQTYTHAQTHMHTQSARPQLAATACTVRHAQNTRRVSG